MVVQANRDISCACQVGADIAYKGMKVGQSRLDLLAEGILVVERKAADSLQPIHKAQVLLFFKALN